MPLTTPCAFAMLEQRPYPFAKQGRCALSGKSIAKGAPVYRIKFQAHTHSPWVSILQTEGNRDGGFRQSVAWFREKRFPAELIFQDPASGADRAAHAFPDLDWRNLPCALARLARLEAPAPQVPDAWTLMGAWSMSDLQEDILKLFHGLPPTLQLLFGLADNGRFRQSPLGQQLLPQWEDVHRLMGKSRLGLDHMLQLAQWGDEHPEVLTRLSMLDEQFGVLNYSINPTVGYSESRYAGHGAHLLYLYAKRPELCPLLQKFDPQAPAAVFASNPGARHTHWGYGSSVYAYPYLYRARVLACMLREDWQGAKECMAAMEKQVDSSYHGSPDGFINETGRMLERYQKKCRPGKQSHN